MKALASEPAPSLHKPLSNFVDPRSIVRKIWGDPDLVLLIFAGSAAEFALSRAVDWLFFTGEIPRDPIGRLFSTVRYAQEIVFTDEETAQRTLERINAQHASVEHDRGQTIPDWAYRDVLYMLIDYSERAYALLYGPLSQSQRLIYLKCSCVSASIYIFRSCLELMRSGKWIGGVICCAILATANTRPCFSSRIAGI